MSEGRCANDGCVHLAVLVDRGHVIRMDERGILAEIPLRPTALPDAEGRAGRRTFNKKYFCTSFGLNDYSAKRRSSGLVNFVAC